MVDSEGFHGRFLIFIPPCRFQIFLRFLDTTSSCFDIPNNFCSRKCFGWIGLVHWMTWISDWINNLFRIKWERGPWQVHLL